MCGIAGIIGSPVSLSLLPCIKKMTDVIRHRGPDDEGFVFFKPGQGRIWLYGGEDTPDSVYRAGLAYTPERPFSGQKHENATLALGHRRLSILDLSPAGHQPMCTPDRRYWIVYNGEIYNYLEIRDELIRKGYRFRSRSDTEVLLAAYVHWGTGALNRLVGMFAFAIYDRDEDWLFLARDFFGIKPLYYTVWPGGFAFASEIKALLTLPHVSRKLNPQRAYEYLRFGLTDHGEDTLFKDIQQLPVAHYLCVGLEGKESPQPVRYWDIDLSKKVDLPFGEAVARMKKLFLKNVELHLRSDVPVGAALSGGIDSSSIVMVMRQRHERSLDLHTFSYIAEDSSVNEEKWVDIVGKVARASTHKIRASPDQLLSDLDQLIHIQDEPFGSTSIYAQYLVMRLAAENGIKVMLDGQGADEILAGYLFYFGARMASLVRHGKVINAAHSLLKASKYPGVGLRSLLLHSGACLLSEALRNSARRLFGPSPVPLWLSQSWFSTHGITSPNYSTASRRDVLRQHLYRSVQIGLPSLLRYEDRNSMAHSIESRVPFLTPELVQFLFSLPEEYLISSNGTTKSLFREAMRGIVPDSILKRRDKIGFATPEEKWIRLLQPWVDSLLKNNTTRGIPALNLPGLHKTWQKALLGQKKFDFTMWRCINFIRWTAQYEVSHSTYP